MEFLTATSFSDLSVFLNRDIGWPIRTEMNCANFPATFLELKAQEFKELASVELDRRENPCYLLSVAQTI